MIRTGQWIWVFQKETIKSSKYYFFSSSDHGYGKSPRLFYEYYYHGEEERKF